MRFSLAFALLSAFACVPACASSDAPGTTTPDAANLCSSTTCSGPVVCCSGYCEMQDPFGEHGRCAATPCGASGERCCSGKYCAAIGLACNAGSCVASDAGTEADVGDGG
jgi:hypothetical protein